VSDRPFVSVIIPAYNAARTLPATLCALARQTYPRERYEVLVVDDGSTDGTSEVAAAYGARVLRQPHQSPAAARNAGARAARGEVLLFTDADCEPVASWIATLVNALEPGVGGAKGVYRTRQRAIVPRFAQAEFEDKYARLAQHEWIDFIDTYSAAYRRADFEAEGGFDPTFPTASAEDVELSFRMAAHGRRLRFVPKAVVYHHHPRTLYAYLRRKAVYAFWRGFVYRRHPGKALRDSYTPATVRLQIPLAAAGLLALLGAPRRGLRPALLCWSLVLATALPFAWRARRFGLDLALASPGLVLARALVQAIGLAAGLALAGSRRATCRAGCWPRR
jgi:glycosyltransferase involved in cell wall biosynthesis